MHPGDAALDELVGAVTGLPTTGDNVEVEPGRPVEELPNGVDAALVVMPLSESDSQTTHDGSQRCELSVAVISYARTRALRSESRREVAAAVRGISTPQRRCVVESVGFERQAAKHKLFAAVTRVRIPYLTSVGVPAA